MGHRWRPAYAARVDEPTDDDRPYIETHDLSLATLHVHLDDDSCMEVTALKGASGEVRHFADHIIAERGVRYGRVVMIPTASDKKPKARKHGHRHE